MSTETSSISMREAIGLAEVLTAAQENRRVRWLTDHGDVCEGVARAIVNRDGGGAFVSGDDNVLDGFLHVSGVIETWLPVRELIETWLPVRELIEKSRKDTFVVES